MRSNESKILIPQYHTSPASLALSFYSLAPVPHSVVLEMGWDVPSATQILVWTMQKDKTEEDGYEEGR